MDTSTLAEDTVTTFQTQLSGRRAIFEPHAVVWAEEPGSIGALWRQRMRWARGNMQVTRKFSSVWFRPQANNRLGSFSFGLMWFCLLLLPVFMLLRVGLAGHPVLHRLAPWPGPPFTCCG